MELRLVLMREIEILRAPYWTPWICGHPVRRLMGANYTCTRIRLLVCLIGARRAGDRAGLMIKIGPRVFQKVVSADTLNCGCSVQRHNDCWLCVTHRLFLSVVVGIAARAKPSSGSVCAELVYSVRHERKPSGGPSM